MVVRRASRFLLPVIYLGFISLGLPDGTFGVAWPEIYPDLALPIGLAGPITTVVTLLAGLSGFMSGRIVARWKTGPVVLVSCLVTGTALLALARAESAAWLFAAAVPLGLGAGAVDAGLNGFVARHYSGRHMNWLHACWGVGATSGPIFMGYALGAGWGWRGGYAGLGAAQLSLAALFLVTLRLWAGVTGGPAAGGHGERPERVPTMPANSPAGWLSPVIFALYVAVETTTGVWTGSLLVVGRGFTPGQAAFVTALYFGSITAGRVATGFMVERWGNRRPVAWGLVLAGAGAVGVTFATTLPGAAVALAALGLGFAPVYPCLMHEVPRRFAPGAVQTVIGRQSGASYLGAAVLPVLAGLVAQHAVTSVPWLVVAGVGVLFACVRRLDRLT